MNGFQRDLLGKIDKAWLLNVGGQAGCLERKGGSKKFETNPPVGPPT